MKVFLILGNGFSIDFLKNCTNDADVDVANLFRLGPKVKWPSTNEAGFLSFRNCPNLWNLGARPTLSTSEASGLIEDIITCANVVASTKKPEFYQEQREQLYVRAYKELSLYLKHLFVYYDKRVQIDKQKLSEWCWTKFFTKAYQDSEITQLTIVTYNYDIWLERALKELEIPFNISAVGNQSSSEKFQVLKPHGSISFAHKICNDIDAFNIPYERELHEAKSEAFEVKYDNLDANYLLNAMIPPAGDSSRLNHSWANEIRSKAKATAETISEKDLVIICGLSYWHVDRNEIDELMVHFNPKINLKMINPAPPRAMTAVLTSLFRDYVQHVDADLLKELLDD